MSRVIKFRAWNKPTKQMLYWGFIYEILTGHGADSRNFEPEHNEWMQFTGLLDKNGKEIYENDLVSSKSHLPEVMQVEFIEGAFCMTHPTIEDYPIDINHFYPSIGTDLIVIGNIYQNPDLIK